MYIHAPNMSAAAKQRTTCSEDSDDDGQTWLTNAFREIHNSPNLDEDLCCVLQAFGESDSDARGVASLDPGRCCKTARV